MDCNVAKPDDSVPKQYDFIYICLKQDEKRTLVMIGLPIINWELHKNVLRLCVRDTNCVGYW